MKGLWTSTISLLRGRSDEESMCRVKAHDDHAEFSSLVRKWEEPIRRLCTRLTGDAGRGEDLKQETFLRLFRHRANYQPTSKFSTFLWRIALNLCHDELRRQQRRREFLAGDGATKSPGADESESHWADVASETPGPDSRAAQREESELVRQALMQLPDIYRTVIVLRHYEGLKLARIAEILEIPEGTVNSRMAEGLNRLSRLLEPTLKTAPAVASQPRLISPCKVSTVI
jgi:RNA polymerase sigma-70 factor (ECF subfamily)